MYWRRARKRSKLAHLDALAALYAQAGDANFGIWTNAPRDTGHTLADVAPAILAQTERRNTALWPALFALWPDWHWGIQPTGDCTRWMQQHCLDTLAATLYAAGKIGRPTRLVAGESIYALAKCELANSYRYHGPGATGYAVAEAATKFGYLLREHYEAAGKTVDLRAETEYSIAWGDRGAGLPDWLEPIAAGHRAGTRVRLASALEMGLAIQAGYPCQYCGKTTWARGQRRADGLPGRGQTATGWHALTATGVTWTDHGEPDAFWIANTGHGDHVDGPVGPLDAPPIYAECGGLVPAATVARVIAAGDCHTCTTLDGWPILSQPHLGTPDYLP